MEKNVRDEIIKMLEKLDALNEKKEVDYEKRIQALQKEMLELTIERNGYIKCLNDIQEILMEK